MTSRLNDAQDAIRTLWEGLTPPTGITGAYRGIRNISNAGRLSFWFVPGSSTGEDEFGHSFQYVRHEFTVHVRLDLTGFDLISANEVKNNVESQLWGSIRLKNDWPTGIDMVNVTKAVPQPTDTDDLDLVFSFVVKSEESDGS